MLFKLFEKNMYYGINVLYCTWIKCFTSYYFQNNDGYFYFIYSYRQIQDDRYCLFYLINYNSFS